MMKKQYTTPQMEVISITKPQLLAGSGPTSGDQTNPGMGNSSSLFFDEDFE